MSETPSACNPVSTPAPGRGVFQTEQKSDRATPTHYPNPAETLRCPQSRFSIKSISFRPGRPWVTSPFPASHFILCRAPCCSLSFSCTQVPSAPGPLCPNWALPCSWGCRLPVCLTAPLQIRAPVHSWACLLSDSKDGTVTGFFPAVTPVLARSRPPAEFLGGRMGVWLPLAYRYFQPWVCTH